MASDLANMKAARQKAGAELLRGCLARCDGHGVGRVSMGEKAQTVEAPVEAYGWNRDEAQTDLGELPIWVAPRYVKGVGRVFRKFWIAKTMN